MAGAMADAKLAARFPADPLAARTRSAACMKRARTASRGRCRSTALSAPPFGMPDLSFGWKAAVPDLCGR
jgi:hypothetical protein